MARYESVCPMPKLIITADDCGLSKGINSVTLDLHRRGFLNAASVMTNFPAHAHALEIFRDCPELDIGAHLTLTDGTPVSHSGPHHSHLLKEDRRFRNKFSLYARALFFSADTAKWIRNELDAQLRRFIDTGKRPRHLTSHHHFHSLPLLRTIVHELAEEYQVDWVRGHDFRANISPHSFLPRRLHQLSHEDFFMPDYVTAIQAWMSRPVQEFAERVASLSGRVEIVVHPGPAVDPDFPSSVGHGPAKRSQETAYLIAAVEALRQRGITLT